MTSLNEYRVSFDEADHCVNPDDAIIAALPAKYITSSGTYMGPVAKIAQLEEFRIGDKILDIGIGATYEVKYFAYITEQGYDGELRIISSNLTHGSLDFYRSDFMRKL